MNAKQTKYIYDILGGDDGKKLYDAVQKAIDKACEDAVSAAACIIEKGCAAAAQNFNGKRI